MESIAIIKPDTGVLSQARLQLSPFGALARAFSEELLARAETEEGRWTPVPLELLEEENPSPLPPAGPSRVTLQVDLRLVLEALGREKEQSEQLQAARRIVERIVEHQSRRDRPAAAPTQGQAPQAPTLLGTVRQSFFHTLNQHIHVTAPLFSFPNFQGRHTSGALARQAGQLSRQFQVQGARESRFSARVLPGEPGAAGGAAISVPPQPLPGQGAPAGIPPEALPREALTLLEARGQEAARGMPVGQNMFLHTPSRLETLVEQALGTHRTPSPGRAFPAGAPVYPPPLPRPDAAGQTAGPFSGQVAGPVPTQAAGQMDGQTAVQAVGPMAGQALRAAFGPTLPPRDIRMHLAQNSRPPEDQVRTPAEEPGFSPSLPLELTLAPGQEAPQETPATSHPAPHPDRTPPRTASPAQPGTSGHAPAETSGTAPTREAATGSHTRETAPQGPDTPRSTALAARDIRVTPAFSPPQGEGSSPQSPPIAQREGAPFLPPPELVLPAGPEGEPGGETARPTTPGKAAPQIAAPSSGPTRRTGAASSPHTSHSRDTGRDGPSVSAAGEPNRGPLTAQAPTTRTGTFQQAPTREAAGTIPAPGTAPTALPTVSRDIRMTPAPQEAGQTNLPDRTAGAVPTQPPVELTLAAGPEEDSTPFSPRSKAGQPSPAGQYPSAREAAPPTGQSAAPLGQIATPGQTTPPTGRSASESFPAALTLSRLPAGTVFPTAAPATAGAAHSGETPLFPAMPPMDHPIPHLPTIARDIRGRTFSAVGRGTAALHPAAVSPSGAAQQAGAPPAGSAPAALPGEVQREAAVPLSHPSASLSPLSQSFPAQGFPYQNFQPGPAGGLPAGETPPPQPVSLTYGPAPGTAGTAGPQAAGDAAQPQESDYVRSLPPWARDFLKTGVPPAGQSRPMGVARDITSLPQPQEEGTVEWTAPGYRPPQAPITYREKAREEQPPAARPVRISDAEIQRTADQVYRIIEDRIRRERRRLGL